MEENKKEIHVFFGDNSREIVKFINSNSINKEDIVTLTTLDGEFILFYYK